MTRSPLFFFFLGNFCLAFPIVAQVNQQDDVGIDEYAIKDENFFPGPMAVGEASATLSGDTYQGLEWVRPLAGGTCCSKLGPVVYETDIFMVGETGAYNIRSNQDGWDGYLLLYQDQFNPRNPTENLVVGDDDGPGGVGSTEIDGVILEADRRYILVTTGFAKGEKGPYTNRIEGAGSILMYNPAIPTLSEWGMVAFILALAGTGLLLRRGL